MLIETIPLYDRPGHEDVSLTAYIHQPSSQLYPGKKRPAVLICPGGAYIKCSDREAEPVALRFASMGYQAYVLRYSTYMEGEQRYPDPKKEPMHPKPERVYPVQLLETGRAMLAIRANADRWMTDPDQVILCGFSAGAHNCALYATRWFEPLVTGPLGCIPEDIRPAAAILCYSVCDYLYMKEYSEKDLTAIGFFMMSNLGYLGVAVPDEALLDAVSPARHVTKQTPPMFLWATAADDLVPVQNSLLMAKALAEQGIPFALHIFECGPHGMSLATQASARFPRQINDTASQWVALAEEWLESRFPLELE